MKLSQLKDIIERAIKENGDDEVVYRVYKKLPAEYEALVDGTIQLIAYDAGSKEYCLMSKDDFDRSRKLMTKS